MTIQIQMVPVTELEPAEYNPRQIKEDEFAKLKKGLGEFGFVDPLIANEDGTLIGGHQRLKAAIELGMTEVPVVFVKLDKMREKALNLALNRLSGEWDYPKLSSLLGEFEGDLNFDIEFTGFDVVESSSLTNLTTPDFTKGPSLLDIYNEDEQVKNNSRLAPGGVLMVSAGSFIHSAGKQENYEVILKMISEFHTSAQPEIKQQLADELAGIAIERITEWKAGQS